MSTPGQVPFATLATVVSSSWSLELDSTAGGLSGEGLGHIVQGVADVNQCLAIIFSTIPGEDPFRPTFGCDLTKYQDIPLPAALPAIVAEVTLAITTWEPRCTIESIGAVYSLTNIGQLIVSITWRPNLGVTGTQQTTIGQQTTFTTQIPVGGVSSL